MGWLRSVGSLKLWVSFAKEPYKRDYILQKRPTILRSLLIVAPAYPVETVHVYTHTHNTVHVYTHTHKHIPLRKLMVLP